MGQPAKTQTDEERLRNTARSWMRLALAAALLVGTGVFLRAHNREEVLPARRELASFPMQIQGWTGRDLFIRDDVRQMLGGGDLLARSYVRSPREPGVTLFIAYFPTQRTGSTIHSPQNCLPGAGWVPVQDGRLTVTRPDGETIRVNRYIVAKGMERELVLYWYQSHGRVVASEYWAKFFLVADSIRLDRSDGSLVRITTAITDRDESVAQRRAVEFARAILPDLDQFIPR